MYLLIILLLALLFFVILPNLFPIILFGIFVYFIVYLIKNNRNNSKAKNNDVIEGEFMIREENENDRKSE